MKKAAASKPNSITLVILFIVSITLITAILLISFSWVPANTLVNKISERISMQYTQELNGQMTAHISSILDHYFEDLDIVEKTLPLIENMDEPKIRYFINGMLNDHRISYLAFVDENGYVYEADSTYPGSTRLNFLESLLSSGSRAIFGHESVGSNDYIMIGSSFDKAISMGDALLCAAILGIKSEDLSDRIVLNSEYSECYSSIINEDGSYIVRNPSVAFSGSNVFSILETEDHVPADTMQELRNAISNDEIYILSVSGKGKEYSAYLYFAPIADSDWYVINCIPGALIKTSVQELQNKLLLVSIIIVTMVVISSSIIIAGLSASKKKLHDNQITIANALQMAEQANKAKTAFLFNMSHDIRTPMNAILGYTDIALNHYDDNAKLINSLNMIKTSGTHLLNLINDILEMSRIESDRLELREDKVDIRQAIEAVCSMGQALALKKSIDMVVSIGEITNPYIFADELHINEVLINLISNAVKYTNQGGKVTYSIEQIGDVKDGRITLRCRISDNGIGMSEEFQQHLFEAFTRENNSTVSRVEGTGLGLSIVKKIVDLAGGTISVKSIPNQGTTFTLDLSFRVMDEEDISSFIKENASNSNMASNASIKGRRVLYVEDNEINREIGKELLSEAGLITELAEDGSIAVNMVSGNGPGYYDAILMDIQMPVMNGYEATKAIRQLPNGCHVPIIALSANAFKEDVLKSLEVGMDGHVAKPIDVKVLFDTLQSLIR